MDDPGEREDLFEAMRSVIFSSAVRSAHHIRIKPTVKAVARLTEIVNGLAEEKGRPLVQRFVDSIALLGLKAAVQLEAEIKAEANKKGP